MESLSTEKVVAKLEENQIPFELFEMESSTATAELAAQEIGCLLGQIVKSLAYFINGQPHLFLLSGDQMLDSRKVADRFGVGKKKIKMASAEQCVAVFGYAPGGVPPIAHRQVIPTLMDDQLQRYEQVYAAAGSKFLNFGIRLDDLAAITQAEFVDIVISPDSSPADLP